MRQNYFFEYVPNAYINLCVDKAQQMANNRFVYDFKAGEKKAAHLCAEWLVRYLTKQYSSILEDFVVVFAPCSTQWKYNKRFGYLAAISMQQASQPQMSTCTSLESASQPTTEAAISSTKTFIMFR